MMRADEEIDAEGASHLFVIDSSPSREFEEDGGFLSHFDLLLLRYNVRLFHGFAGVLIGSDKFNVRTRVLEPLPLQSADNYHLFILEEDGTFYTFAGTQIDCFCLREGESAKYEQKNTFSHIGCKDTTNFAHMQVLRDFFRSEG